LANQDRASGPLLRDLGISVCKVHRKEPQSEAFAVGQGYLRRAVDVEKDDVDAWASLGGAWRTREEAAQDPERREYRQQAEECYRRAWLLRPSHSYSLGNYLEYLVADHPDLDILSFFRPSMDGAAQECRRQVRVGLNLPWALFDLGKFELLMGAPHEALCWYARGIFRSTSSAQIDSALRSFTTLRVVRDKLTGFAWSERLLQLALGVPFADDRTARLVPSVVIIAGACGATAAEHRRLLGDAFGDFRGTLISGGTEAGVCGLVGEVQADNPALHTVGDLPAHLPAGVSADRRYRCLRSSDGLDFSPWEALLYWSDILGQGIAARDVRLLCLGGGPITRCECAVALALGAQVGIVEVGTSPLLSQEAIDPFWERVPPVRHRLPAEAAAIRRFIDPHNAADKEGRASEKS
jgi:hypothetical protein